MDRRIYEPAELDAALEEQLLDIWERTVAATHDFFSDCGETIRFKRPYVIRDPRSMELICFADGNDVAGFAAVSGDELKMLYVPPERHRSVLAQPLQNTLARGAGQSMSRFTNKTRARSFSMNAWDSSASKNPHKPTETNALSQSCA